MSRSRLSCEANLRAKPDRPAELGASDLDQEIVALGAELRSMDEQRHKKQRQLDDLQQALMRTRNMVDVKAAQVRAFADAIPEVHGHRDPITCLDALVDLVDGGPPVLTPAKLAREVSATRALVTDLETRLVCELTTPPLHELETLCRGHTSP
jgi:hypothetical protein